VALGHCVDRWRRRLPDLQISLQLQGAARLGIEHTPAG
jgi:hypothetical protein